MENKCLDCYGTIKEDDIVGQYCEKCGVILGTRLQNHIKFKQSTRNISKTKIKELKCFSCQKTTDLQRHHIIPRRVNGKNKDNLIVLCMKCHKIADKLCEQIYPILKVIEE